MSNELIDQLPGGIILLDEAGNITRINATAEQQLGYGPGELVGHSFGQLLTVAGRLFYQTHFYPLVSLHGRVDELALTFLTRTGERIPILLNAIRQQREDGWYVHCVYLSLVQRHQLEAELIQARKAAEEAQAAVQEREAQYRTLAAQLEERVGERTHELREANARLHHLNADLERSNGSLQTFAYIASHDLQEPLRKVQQFGDLLQAQYSEVLGEGVGYLARMQAAASRMSTLIKDLLSYSRITTQWGIDTPVSLTEILDGVLVDLELSIRESGAQVSVGPLPTVVGDATQLSQLFQNLLSNALKFSRVDRWGVSSVPQIAITAQLIKAVELPPAVRPARSALAYHQIEVTDNGVGFEEKYLDRIFQVFQRLHGKNEFAGTGIGLAICEKVAAIHGGTITARSQPGHGATFSVYLPEASVPRFKVSGF